MIVYDSIKTDFLTSCERDQIAIEIKGILILTVWNSQEELTDLLGNGDVEITLE